MATWEVLRDESAFIYVYNNIKEFKTTTKSLLTNTNNSTYIMEILKEVKFHHHHPPPKKNWKKETCNQQLN